MRTGIAAIVTLWIALLALSTVLAAAAAVPSASEALAVAQMTDGSSAQSQSASWRDSAIAWSSSHAATVGGACAAVAGALIAGLYFLSRTRPPQTEGQVSDTPPNTYGDTLVCAANPNPKQVYAWLQFLDAEARRVPIGYPNIRIGRHWDNDIVLQNKTVHRKHAILLLHPDQRFSINDLGGENGTLVNGERIRERDLKDSDLIEFGEVRMRFFRNNCGR